MREKKKGKGRGLIFSVLHIAASNGVKSVLTLASSLIVARLLGPMVMGHVGTARLIGRYGGLATIGASLGMGQQVPILRGQGDVKTAKQVKSCVLWYLYLLSVLGLAVIPLFLFLPFEGEFRLVVCGGILFCLASFFQNFINVELSVERRFRHISMMNVCVAVMTALSIPLAYLALPGALGRLVFITLFEFFLGWYFIRSSLRGKFSWPVFRRVIAEGFPILVIGFLQQFTFIWDRTLVRGLMGAEALGLYTVASLVISTSGIIPQALSRVLYPNVGEIYGRTGDVQQAAKVVVRHFPFIVGMCLLVVPGCYFVIPPFIKFFLPEYTEGIQAAQIATLAGGGVFLCYGIFLFNIIRRVRYVVLCEILGLFVQTVISFILYTKFQMGLTSFSLGTSVGLMMMGVCSLSMVWLIAKGIWRFPCCEVV